MKSNFVAFDFETSSGHIPCSIGVVEFVDGKVVSEYYSLIKPIDLKFNPINSRINGIYLEDVLNEREFDEVWKDIEHLFVDRVIVSHNSSTDVSVLNKTLDYYKILKFNFESYCTLQMARRVLDIENYKLSTLAKHFNIQQVNYHNSLEDAFVCGKAFIELFESFNNIGFKNVKKINSKISVHYLPSNSTLEKVDKFSTKNCSEILKGKIFVVSGVFEQFSRDELKKAIEDNGGKVGSSISSKTDYVLAGANMGPAKLEKASKLNIAIISEIEFMNLIN
jgi:DNA polymerase-3 subunit epsilon